MICYLEDIVCNHGNALFTVRFSYFTLLSFANLSADGVLLAIYIAFLTGFYTLLSKIAELF